MKAPDLFRDLAIGDRFDFNGGPFPSFTERCEKVSPRCYVDASGRKHQVGTVNAVVYHVEPRRLVEAAPGGWNVHVPSLPCGCPLDSGCDARHEPAV